MKPSAVRAHVVALLKGSVAVVRLCKDRIFADAAPFDEDLPLVAVRRTSHARGRTMTGLSDEAKTGLQVTVVANDPESRDDVANAVRDALESQAGLAGADLASLRIVGDADGVAWLDDAGASFHWIATFDVEALHSRAEAFA